MVCGCLAAPAAASAATPIPLGRAASAAPELAFEPSAVVASGLLAEGEAIFHGVSRQRQAYVWRVVQTREVAVADPEGVVRLELPEGEEVAPRSVWTVVDPVTGDFAIGSPPGFTPSEIEFPANGLGESEVGAWRVLRSRFERMEVLYVRPGVGAWRWVAADGTGSDDDGRDDSRVAARLEDAELLWGSEPVLRGFSPGDVVVAVSLDTLDFFAARLVEPGTGP